MHEFDNSNCRDFDTVKQLLNSPDKLTAYLSSDPCFNAIRSVHNINKELLKNIAAEFNELIDMSDTIELYRSVVLSPEQLSPELDNPGICWTDSYNRAEEFGDDLIEGLDDYVNCIITAKFNNTDVDWIYSIACRLDEPEEKEIRIFKDAVPVHIDYEVL